jgi:hypothetical protein
MRSKTVIFALVLAAAATGAAFADGGGGTFMGYTLGADELPDRIRIAASGPGLMYFGGYGYGVGRRGVISGGFGLALMDSDVDGGMAGGVGGFISGIRILRIPLHLAVVSWTGLGGVFTGDYETGEGSGYFIGYEEVDLELGIPIISWFMPTVYVGYQVVGNLLPGRPFQSSFLYNPVAGVRISWGDFR